MGLTTITNAMVSVNAIQGTLIADNAITAVHIATNAVSSTLIADNAVTAVHIAQNVITVTQLADDAVEADKIADGVITTNHLNKAMISSQTEVAVATGDFVLLGDTSDSNALKKAPISSILAGTLTTAAQANITSLGTLTGLTVNGAAVFNENSADVDFRIESNGNANMLFVDGDNNRVGVGTGTLNREFTVQKADQCDLAIVSANNQSAQLCFGDTDDDNIGVIGYDHSTNDMIFTTNTRAQMRLTSEGYLSIYGPETTYTSPNHTLVVGSIGDANGIALHGRNNGSDDEGLLTFYNYAGTTAHGYIMGANSGIVVNGTDNIQIRTGGTTRLTVGSGGDFDFVDNSKLRIGTGNDLQIWHDASDSYIRDVGTGNLLIQSSDMYFGDASSNHHGRWNMSDGVLSIGDLSPESGNLSSTKCLFLQGGETVMMIKNETASDASNRPSIGFLDSGGDRRGYIYTSDSATDIVTSSDYREKENVTTLINGLSRVNALKPVKFKWKHNDTYTEGFLAHEVQEAGWNEGVTGEKDGEEMQAVSYGRITPLLVKAIQELSAKNDALEARIAELEA